MAWPSQTAEPGPAQVSALSACLPSLPPWGVAWRKRPEEGAQRTTGTEGEPLARRPLDRACRVTGAGGVQIRSQPRLLASTTAS